MLAAGDDATIRYQVRYTGDGDMAGRQRRVRAGGAGGRRRKRVHDGGWPGSGLSQTKSSDPGDGSTVDAGDEITYTLTFTNTGSAPVTVDTTDDLSGVLDDAEMVDGPNAGPGLTATRNGDQIEVTGSVLPGSPGR